MQSLVKLNSFNHNSVTRKEQQWIVSRAIETNWDSKKGLVEKRRYATVVRGILADVVFVQALPLNRRRGISWRLWHDRMKPWYYSIINPGCESRFKTVGLTRRPLICNVPIGNTQWISSKKRRLLSLFLQYIGRAVARSCICALDRSNGGHRWYLQKWWSLICSGLYHRIVRQMGVWEVVGYLSVQLKRITFINQVQRGKGKTDKKTASLIFL